MNPTQINELLKQGEGINIEFKESVDSLSRSVFETICAFLNRKGGHLLLGVQDDGSVIGVNEGTISTQLETLAKDMNNPQVIAPTFYLSPQVIEIQQKKVIYIYVPESSQAHRRTAIKM